MSYTANSMGIGQGVHWTKEKFRLLVGIAGLGAFLLGVGVLVTLLISQPEWRDAQTVKEETEKMGDGKEAGEESKEVVIDVAGAVEKPGLYRLSTDSRINDALVAAGGLSAEADRVWVTKNINLAQKVSDGIKIFIPFTTGRAGQAGVVLNSQDDGQQQTVSINTATATELEDLWGVGAVRARGIIDGRPYGSIDELVTRKIVPQSVIEKNKEKLSL